MLTSLGDPAPNAAKWFSAVEMIRLATVQDWLNKSTKEIAKHWRHKRERQPALVFKSYTVLHQAAWLIKAAAHPELHAASCFPALRSLLQPKEQVSMGG
jgi:hypothetical protein